MDGIVQQPNLITRLLVNTRCLACRQSALSVYIHAATQTREELWPKGGTVAPVGDAVAHGAKLELLDIAS